MPVQPDTEIMQGSLGRQPGLKAVQLVRPLPVQGEGMVELVENRLHHLAYPGWRIPASQRRNALGQGFLLLLLGGQITRAP